MVVHAFPSADILTLRPLTPADVPATLRVFREAVRSGASEHYTEAERNAWAHSVMDAGAWKQARLAQPTWVAEVQGETAGFADLTDKDEVGMLYVHPSFTRRGVGSALLEEVERQARERDRLRLHARVSLVAEPVFARAGFMVLRRQWAERSSQRLVQAVMEKLLEPI